MLSNRWINIDSTVKGMNGDREETVVRFGPRKKGQKSYCSLEAFVAKTHLSSE